MNRTYFNQRLHLRKQLTFFISLLLFTLLYTVPGTLYARDIESSTPVLTVRDQGVATNLLDAATLNSTSALTSTTATTITTTADDPFAAWNQRNKVTREAAYPVQVQIPAIGVDAAVEAIGEQANGAMATPTDPNNVAWYSYGAIPGENGSVVMAGHLDKADASRAVFWDLGKLVKGDEIIITDVSGTRYRYVVTGSQSYSYNKAPLKAIFGFDLASRLNLITCRGSWDRNRQTYSQRLVVTSELVEISQVDQANKSGSWLSGNAGG